MNKPNDRWKKIFSKMQQFSNEKVSLTYFKKGFSPIDAIIFAILFFMNFTLAIITAINPVNYPEVTNLPLQALSVFPAAMICVSLLGHWRHLTQSVFLKKLSATFSVLVYTMITTLIISAAFHVLILTPFKPIDTTLVNIDRFIGFNVTHFMSWSHQNHSFYQFMVFCYNSWAIQLLLLPSLAMLVLPFKSALRYMLCLLISFTIIAAIYFFFPTAAPASVLSSPYFLKSQHIIAQRFADYHQQILNHLPIEGLISFPSPHVVGAFCITLLFWRRWIYFIPMAIFNSFVCLSTIALGFHYLIDIIAAAFIAVGSFYLANTIMIHTPQQWRSLSDD